MSAALVIGLGLGFARSVMARPASSETAVPQIGQTTASSASVVSAPPQSTPVSAEPIAETPTPPAGDEGPAATSPATTEPPVPRSTQAYAPTRIVVSAIGVDAPVIPIALEVQGDAETEAQWEVPEPDVAGWHETSAPLGVPGNTVINGHNWPQEAVFRNLYKVQPGEAIALYADDLGFAYEVIEVVLLPEQGQPWEIQLANTHYIDPTDDDRLTIVTCHPYGSVRYRLVVVATRIESAQPDG
jgi:sortase A